MKNFSTERRLFLKRGVFVSLLLTICIPHNVLSVFRAGIYPEKAEAASVTLSSASDIKAGFFNGTEADSSNGNLKLTAGGTWGPREYKTPDLALADHAAVVSDGTYIYAIGSVDNRFMRYLPSEDRWQTLRAAPHFSMPGSDMKVVGDSIYVIFGGYSNNFAKYSISANTWTSLANLPDLVYTGASLGSDGTYVYALRGANTTDFWKYDPSVNTWSSLSAPPAYIGAGGSLVYDDGILYTPRGAGTTTFYSFNISTGTWSTLTVLPGTMSEDTNIATDGTSIFVLRGIATTVMYKYSISGNSWATTAATPAVTRYVGLVYNQADGYIYVFRGNSTYDFWKYNIASDQFLGPTDLPFAPGTGSDLVNYNGVLYSPRGAAQTSFYGYTMSNGVWSSLASIPSTFNDDTKGASAGSQLYFFRGSSTTTFYSYDPAANTWNSSLAVTPAAVGAGGAIIYPGSGDYLYATRGGNTLSFWRYSINGNTWDDAGAADLPTGTQANIGSRLATDRNDTIYYISGQGNPQLLKYTVSTNTWSTLNTVPFSPYYGTDMTYHNGKLYVQAGFYKPDFYEYNIALNSWLKLPNIQTRYAYDIGPYNGAALASDGGGHLFSTEGQSLTNMSQFTIGSSNYPASGTWTSNTQDLTYVASFTSLTASTTTPGDSSVVFETRTSADKITWSSWQSVSGGTIASASNRYIQIRATLSPTTDNTQAPTLESVTVNYTGDTAAPTNPTSVTGSSQIVSGTALTDGNTYAYSNPYFSWSGAADSATAVSGYYVYFGTSSSADPETDGNFQAESTYLVTNSLSNGTYYLRIKTKDSAGNISSAVTGFTYVYDGVTPQSTTKTTSADFSAGGESSVSTLNDQISLASASSFWQQKRLSYIPAGTSYGASFAYVSSSNKLYAFRGGNTTGFYEYDISTDTWTTKTVTLSAVNYGGGIAAGPTGYLYGTPGINTSTFWRYDIENNTWSDSGATDAPQPFGYGSSLMYDGSRYIYALKGNNDDTFMRYDTQADVWDTLANVDFGAPSNHVNNLVYSGGDLAYDGSDTIYAIQGNSSSGFASYSIASNAWTSLTNAPGSPTVDGSQIEYDSASNAVYFTSATNTPYLFKYDISTGAWSQLPDAPASLYYGSAVKSVGGKLYVFRGSSTTVFYSYDIALASWEIPTQGLFGGLFRGTDYRSFGYGADIVKGDGNNFYITRGAYDNLFIRYDYTTGVVEDLSSPQGGFYLGGALVYDSVNNKIYATFNSAYNHFYQYDIATDTWTDMSSDVPPYTVGAGASMTFDGSRYIYLIPGNGSTGLARYDTQGDSGSRWATRAVSPGTFSYGAEIRYKNGYIYALRGGNTLPFYRYDVSANTWSDPAVADLPAGVTIYNDGFLVDSGSNTLYACRGGNQVQCYSYSIDTNTWTVETSAPANIYTGGAAASNGSDRFFAIAGGGTNTYTDGLYSFVMQTTNSSFAKTGTYTTPTIDLTSVYRFGGLSATYTATSNATLAISTRTSSDNSTWTAWATASQQKVIGSTYSYRIPSAANRYIQVKFDFTSSDGLYSGVVSDYVIYYYSDSEGPANPTTLTAHSTATQSAAMTTNSWYNHSAPYFSWPAAEAAGGASDSSAGNSGISGYYVYFGTSASADASTSGSLQTATNYTASSLASGSTYYLRIQAVDDAGNIASSNWQPFIYKFDNVAPDNPTTVTADPSGYTATNSFAFAWSGATDDESGINDYCYKTALGGTENCSVTAASMSGVLAGGTGASTFYVRARDAAGNAPTTYSSVSYYYSATAPSAPQNLAVSPTSNTVNQFSFSWDPPSIYFGAQASLRYFYSANALPTTENVNQVGLSVTNLATDAYATVPGDNTMYVVAKDEAGNIDYNNYASITFTADTSAPGIPKKMDIADISVKSLSAWKLAVSWEAPDASGSGVASYKVYSSTTSDADCTTDFSDFSYLASTTGRSYVDTDLTQQDYYYCVKACDSTNNCSAVSDTVTKYPTGKYETAADLTASPSATVKTKSAIITWSTSRASNSFVKYGTSSGDYGDEVGSSTQVTSHTISLDNLAPGTTYYYKISWTDEDGNVGTTGEKTFATNPAPVVSSVKITNISIKSVYVNFTVQYATSVKIQYGKTINYGGLETLSTSTGLSSHTVQLEDLEEGTEYHIQIVAEDEEGNTFAGDDHTFDTLPQPKITALKMQQVAGQPTATFRLLWTSNTLISTIVTYYPTAVPTAAKDQISLVFKKTHDVIITNLIDDTDYTVVVKGKDSAGNEATYPPQKVKTAVDLRSPEIGNMNVETTITGVGDQAKAQLVVSWDTDEPATTQIEYAEGTGTSYSQSTQEDTNKTANHVVTISGLIPSKIYHLRAVSKDKSSNVGQSFDTVIVTPKSTKDALNLVIDNLAKTFGFLKNIGQ